MANSSKGWTRITKARFQASGAVQYVIDVADGEVKPNAVRVNNAWRMINKLIPDMKAVELTGTVHSVEWKLPQITAQELTNILPTLPPSVLRFLSGIDEQERQSTQLMNYSDKSPPNLELLASTSDPRSDKPNE